MEGCRWSVRGEGGVIGRKGVKGVEGSTGKKGGADGVFGEREWRVG